MTTKSGRSLLSYGCETYQRDNYTCVYCGFDGRTFDNWLQLSVDHILPRSSGGGNELENLATSCRSCNSITSRMVFAKKLPRKEIIEKKRAKVAERRQEFYEIWHSEVAPDYLKRPLPKIKK